MLIIIIIMINNQQQDADNLNPPYDFCQCLWHSYLLLVWLRTELPRHGADNTVRCKIVRCFCMESWDEPIQLVCGRSLPRNWHGLDLWSMHVVFNTLITGGAYMRQGTGLCLVQIPFGIEQAPSLYLNQFSLIVNWTFQNKLRWKLNQGREI